METVVTRRQQLTEVQLAALYDAPAEQRELVRHYTLSDADLAAVGRCRGDHNRLGFAVMLSYLRHPGRPIRAGERPPAALVKFVAEQIDVLPEALDEYLRFDQNRRRHSTELQERLRLRPYGRMAEPDDTNVVDLMSALRASLGAKDKGAAKPAAKEKPTKAPAKAKTRKAS
jgi:hypothetical protein